MLSDVTHSKGPKEGVAEGMDCHIPVRVGDTSGRTVYPHTAQEQRQPFRKGMYIISVAYPYICHVRNFCLQI